MNLKLKTIFTDIKYSIPLEVTKGNNSSIPYCVTKFVFINF